MRVITGSARGRKLEAPQGLETRPTSDMVKEAMFSIIQFEVEEAMVLDLFAGSGQLGIEALSRGAKFAVFVDASREAQEVIRANLQSTGLAQKSRVAAMDALGFLKSTGDRFSIALLDPPYQKGLLDEALPLLAGKMEEGLSLIHISIYRKKAEAFFFLNGVDSGIRTHGLQSHNLTR